MVCLSGGISARSLAGSLSGSCSTLRIPEEPSWSGRVKPPKVMDPHRVLGPCVRDQDQSWKDWPYLIVLAGSEVRSGQSDAARGLQ